MAKHADTSQPTAAIQVPRTVKFRVRGKQPPTHSRWKGRRVQSFGCRIVCSNELVHVLRATLSEKRAARKIWAAPAWQEVVDRVRESRDWGVLSHGGAGRKLCKRPAGYVSATMTSTGCSADGDHQSESASVVQPMAIADRDDDASSTAVCVSPPRTPVNEHIGDAQVLPPTLPSVPILPKKLVGYTIIEHVGGGSSGDVYKASLKLPRSGVVTIVAIKVMSKHIKSAKRSVEQGRELAILKELTGLHSHIIELLAWRDTHFNFQLVFPFVHLDLRKFIAQHVGLVPIDAARAIGSQLFSALVFIHKRSILHRDIKPENILVRGQPLAAQLSDFGAARRVLPYVGTGTREPLTPDVCTLWYRAPEILLTHDTYSFPADVWSLGMSIAHIELGHSPFRQSTEIGMMFDICKALGPPASGSPLAKFCFGVMGKPLFPSFKAAGGAWGNRYGMVFELWLNNIAKLAPCGRFTATRAQQLQW
jgi:hypothetical protein